MSNYISLPKNRAALAGLVLISIILPDTAFAQAALFDSGTNFLTALQDLLTGTWARIIAVIAICCLGILWMSGRMAWNVATSIIGGIVLIFGAPAIVDSISGSL